MILPDSNSIFFECFVNKKRLKVEPKAMYLFSDNSKNISA